MKMPLAEFFVAHSSIIFDLWLIDKLVLYVRLDIMSGDKYTTLGGIHL